VFQQLRQDRGLGPELHFVAILSGFSPTISTSEQVLLLIVIQINRRRHARQGRIRTWEIFSRGVVPYVLRGPKFVTPLYSVRFYETALPMAATVSLHCVQTSGKIFLT
jgi:hypothetical protein